MGLIVGCTAKPCDGLLYYSYEYASILNTQLVIIPHPDFTEQDYIDSITEKYIHCQNVEFEYFSDPNDVVLVMGRSCITLPWKNRNRYTHDQILSLMDLFAGKLIVVYSENHPKEYYVALDYWNPKAVHNLCDQEVYPNGVGDHFEKTINFSIYKEPVSDIKYDHLFLGTNREYYSTASILFPLYSNSCIITYNQEFVNPLFTNIFAPVKNLLGLFDTYVYTKTTFDPAPRLMQECKYYGKNIIYQRDKSIVDGGSVYYKRDIIDPDVSPILKAMKELS